MIPRIRRAALSIVLALPILACGLSGALTETAFVASCTAECAAQGADRGLCDTYCRCGYTWASDNERLDELETAQVVPGQLMPPVMVDLISQCGSDVWDANFRQACVQSCTGPTCQTRCDCFLRELRGAGPREASTRFLVENLDVEPATAAGEARMAAAEQVCLQ